MQGNFQSSLLNSLLATPTRDGILTGDSHTSLQTKFEMLTHIGKVKLGRNATIPLPTWPRPVST